MGNVEGAPGSPVDADRPIAPGRTGVVDKGLRNLKGENNCFVNVCIQALWHLDSMRERVVNLSGHPPHFDSDADSCMFCALRTLFTYYAFADDAVLPPDSVRHLLASLYGADDRFQLGETDDASEAMDAILRCLHADQIRRERAAPGPSRHSSRHVAMVERARALSRTAGSLGASVTAAAATATATMADVKRAMLSARADLRAATGSVSALSHGFGYTER
mmetsp:Transcript_26589/g.92424  ORF Transcript_26589/g.92424 Transcript_26589/m.92424 type:complete len:220 (-) Transcript_26589:62-721(-)